MIAMKAGIKRTGKTAFAYCRDLILESMGNTAYELRPKGRKVAFEKKPNREPVRSETVKSRLTKPRN